MLPLCFLYRTVINFQPSCIAGCFFPFLRHLDQTLRRKRLCQRPKWTFPLFSGSFRHWWAAASTWSCSVYHKLFDGLTSTGWGKRYNLPRNIQFKLFMLFRYARFWAWRRWLKALLLPFTNTISDQRQQIGSSNPISRVRLKQYDACS